MKTLTLKTNNFPRQYHPPPGAVSFFKQQFNQRNGLFQRQERKTHREAKNAITEPIQPSQSHRRRRRRSSE